MCGDFQDHGGNLSSRSPRCAVHLSSTALPIIGSSRSADVAGHGRIPRTSRGATPRFAAMQTTSQARSLPKA
jgi:hypothetical protein